MQQTMRTSKELSVLSQKRENILLGMVEKYVTEQNSKAGKQREYCWCCHANALQFGETACRCSNCGQKANIFDLFQIYERAIPKAEIIRILSNRYNVKNTVLDTVTATELLDMDLKVTKVIIQNILSAGTYLFSGSPKVGKSWMVLYWAIQIANGNPIWNNNTTQGSVLYLCLEDNWSRVQKRYEMLSDEQCSDLHFSIESELLGNGLEEQLTNFITLHEDTALIIVDTLQKVRDSAHDYNYSNDYEIISRLKHISDDKNIAIIIVHHTRKAESNNVFDMISGTNGLLGASDGGFVLIRDDKTKTAKISISGRDIEDRVLLLDFNSEYSMWNFKGFEDANDIVDDNPLLVAIADLVKSNDFVGTASELIEKLSIDIQPNVLSRKLRDNFAILQNDFKIKFDGTRKSGSRIITLSKLVDNDDNNTPLVIDENIDISS